MYTFLTILTIIVCILLILFVLVQNPKGGGLSSTFGGASSQLMGVKKTGDFLEKSTWGLAIALLALSLSLNFFIDRSNGLPTEESQIQEQIDRSEVPNTNSPSPVPVSPVDTLN